MHEVDGRSVPEVAIPLDESRLIGMGRETADRVDLCIDADFLTEDANAFGTVDEAPAERALGLECGIPIARGCA